jgi:hypothetical protein
MIYHGGDPNCGCDWRIHPEPCPFCGANSWGDPLSGDALNVIEVDGHLFVACACGASGPWADDEDLAVAAWNERHISTVVVS